MGKLREKTRETINKEIIKLPYLALIVSLLLTIGLTFLSYTSATNKDKIRFNNKISKIEGTLQSKIATYETILKATKGFIETKKELNRDNFATFISNLNLEKEFGGVQGIGYTVKVLPEDKQKLTDKIREEWLPSFKMFPDVAKDEYQAIIYLEPVDFRNKRAIGFDMTSEKIRREAMFEARDTGKITASGKIKLLQETDKNVQAGFLVYLPVYEGMETPQTVEERRSTLKGYVYSPFRAGDFLSDITNIISEKEIGILVYDLEISADNLLAESIPNLVNLGSRNETVKEIDFGVRKWKVVYKAMPEFYDNSNLNLTVIVFIIGVFLSGFVFFITYLEAASRQKFQIIAQNLSVAEKEKAQLLIREKEARKAAERSNRAKDNFISTVSHELRTPLNAISGWTRILKGDQLTGKTKERAIKTIEKSIKTQSDLIEDLLDFSKTNETDKESDSNLVNFSKIFKKVAILAEEKALLKGVKFISENNLDGQTIIGDAEKLEKVFHEIVKNALKFTPPQGAIKTTIDADNAFVFFKVEDTGKGIKEDYLPKVFEGFSQQDASSTRKHGGLGIGLAYAKNIIENHGGEISVKSEGENKGTTLIVKIPHNQESLS